MNNNIKENDGRKTGEIQIERSAKAKREICAVTNRGKREIDIGHGVLYNQCFPGADYQSQYEEECPVNYSLKYSETDSCKGGKPEVERTNGKFKVYAEYAETDLDQPTDFSLKYGESEEGDKKMWSSPQKPSDFNFYERHKSKESGCFNGTRKAEEMPGGPEREHYSCEDVTPLMFSRCSSLNSLSSFELITHSIPDDRSSVVSEFSMTTSGIISPSELPDSPTQTAPSSPKRVKPVCFPLCEDVRQKKSVFEDDVATYKQEDTPIEFSRATSLSSLNIDNPVKVDSNLKTNSKASSVAGGDDSKVKDISHYTIVDGYKSENKENSFVGKAKIEDLTPEDCGSVSEVDDILIEGINNIRIDEDRMASGLNGMESDDADIVGSVDAGKSRHIRTPSPQSQVKPSQRLSSNGEFKVQTTIPPIFSNPTYEASDDDVHTYHTEGTPANISHAGSHSDLSTLSLISGVPPSGTANNSDNDSFCSEGEEALNESCERLNLPEENMAGSFNSLNEGRVEDIYSKSCSPLDEALVEQCIRMGMPQKTNSIKLNERASDNWFSKSCTPFEEALVEQCIRLGMPRKSKKEPFNVMTSSESPVDNWFSKPCTPLEEALVEQCIRLGMPKKNRKTELINSGGLKDVLDQRFLFPLKPAANPRRQFGDVKISQMNPRNYQYPPKPVSVTPPPFPSYPVDLSRRTRSVSSLPASDNHWYNQEPESSCTPFEEALVEQCIRLGMPQRIVASERGENNANKGAGSVEKSLASAKTSSTGTQANRSRVSRSSDKEKEALKKPERFVCNPVRRQVGRRKKSKETCRRCRKCREKSRSLV